VFIEKKWAAGQFRERPKGDRFRGPGGSTAGILRRRP
jgi:hypothetical protein